jgi:hypothetical protein
MQSVKKKSKKGFFSSDHGAELSLELAKEYLRQAGVTSAGQISGDDQVKSIREVVRTSLTPRKGSAKGFRGLKRLARK